MGDGSFRKAPAWDVEQWLGAAGDLSLEGLRGRVVVALAFQMLCPGCAGHALPQLKRVHELFHRDVVAAVGLHTVFENHEAQGPAALDAFLRDRHFDFPVAIDRREPGEALPVTMRRYQMQGTPTLILIDAQGRLRQQTFGPLGDLRLGAAIMALIAETEGGGPVLR